MLRRRRGDIRIDPAQGRLLLDEAVQPHPGVTQRTLVVVILHLIVVIAAHHIVQHRKIVHIRQRQHLGVDRPELAIHGGAQGCSHGHDHVVGRHEIIDVDVRIRVPVPRDAIRRIVALVRDEQTIDESHTVTQAAHTRARRITGIRSREGDRSRGVDPHPFAVAVGHIQDRAGAGHGLHGTPANPVGRGRDRPR